MAMIHDHGSNSCEQAGQPYGFDIDRRKADSSSLASREFRRYTLMYTFGDAKPFQAALELLFWTLVLVFCYGSRLNSVGLASCVGSEVVFMSAVCRKEDGKLATTDVARDTSSSSTLSERA